MRRTPVFISLFLTSVHLCHTITAGDGLMPLECKLITIKDLFDMKFALVMLAVSPLCFSDLCGVAHRTCVGESPMYAARMLKGCMRTSKTVAPAAGRAINQYRRNNERNETPYGGGSYNPYGGGYNY
jgi:hypothetical protein